MTACRSECKKARNAVNFAVWACMLAGTRAHAFDERMRPPPPNITKNLPIFCNYKCQESIQQKAARTNCKLYAGACIIESTGDGANCEDDIFKKNNILLKINN